MSDYISSTWYQKDVLLYVVNKYSRASLIRTNSDSGMFGLVNFGINRILQNTRQGVGGIGDFRALSSECQRAVNFLVLLLPF
jgi:hypothetical protein